MVKAAFHKWQAVAQKYPQAFALPDPMVSGRYYVRQMAPEEEKWELMVSQSIPYPGKLVLAGRIADKTPWTLDALRMLGEALQVRWNYLRGRYRLAPEEAGADQTDLTARNAKGGDA